MFITFEGTEGSGKSTQAARLAAALGPSTLLTREPGATPMGQQLRGLLLGPSKLEPAAEALLFFADRAQHVEEVLRPALKAGRTVVCDRFSDSTVAYQGYGRLLPLDLVNAAARLAAAGLSPDLTLWLDVPVRVGLERAAKRGAADRLESEVVEFHERVRNGYLELATREPRRWIRLDAVPAADQVFARLMAELEARGVSAGEQRGVR